MSNSIKELSNAVRFLSIDAVEKSKQLLKEAEETLKIISQNIELKEATRRWQAQFIGEETKAPNKEWEDFLMLLEFLFLSQNLKMRLLHLEVLLNFFLALL